MRAPGNSHKPTNLSFESRLKGSNDELWLGQNGLSYHRQRLRFIRRFYRQNAYWLFIFRQRIILAVQIGDPLFGNQIRLSIQRKKIDVGYAGVGQEEVGEEFLNETGGCCFAIGDLDFLRNPNRAWAVAGLCKKYHALHGLLIIFGIFDNAINIHNTFAAAGFDINDPSEWACIAYNLDGRPTGQIM